MFTLSDIDNYINESVEPEVYSLSPANFADTDGVSYEVYSTESKDEPVAVIKIKMTDGELIDAINSDYTYSDVYADVEIDDTIDIVKDSAIVSWIVDKLGVLGYDENPIIINGDEQAPVVSSDEDDVTGDDSNIPDEVKDEIISDIQD